MPANSHHRIIVFNSGGLFHFLENNQSFPSGSVKAAKLSLNNLFLFRWFFRFLENNQAFPSGSVKAAKLSSNNSFQFRWFINKQDFLVVL